MKNLRRTFTVLFAAAFSMQVLAQREDKLINQDWSFRFSHQVNASAARRVDLPHTWNAQDALGGKHDYKRGIGNYTKKIFIRPEWQGKRLFLRFEGANCVSNVFVNGKHIGEHRGGYGAFVFEITDKVEYGKENTLLVRVNNGEQLDVMPLVGDFNFYGGIYRDVHLLLTDNLCISPLDYDGLFLHMIKNIFRTHLLIKKIYRKNLAKQKQIQLIYSIRYRNGNQNAAYYHNLHTPQIMSSNYRQA